MQIWQAENDERVRQEQKVEQQRQYDENEKQRIAAQALADKRYADQIAREDSLVAEQRATAAKAAEEARALEAGRVAQINAGRGQIENAFSGFNDAYYGNAAKQYQDAYLPGLEKDRLKSADKLTAALTGRGTLESTVGINAFADLEDRAATERASIAARGSEFANSLRSAVQERKGSLFDAAANGGDPSAWASRATGDATNILDFGGIVPAGPANAYGSTYYSPQGGTTTVPGGQNSSVFGSVLGSFANSATAAFNAPKTRTTIAQATGAPTTGTGTAKVVG